MTSSTLPALHDAVPLPGRLFGIPPLARAWLIVLTLGINLLGLVLPMAILQFYDRIIPNHAVETLVALILMVLIAQAAEAVLVFIRAERIAWHAARFEHRAAGAMFDRLVFATDAQPDIPARLSTQFLWIGRLKDQYAGNGAALALDVPFLALFLGIMAIIGGWIAVIPLAAFGVAVLSVLVNRRRNARLVTAHVDAIERQLDFSLQALAEIEQIKSLGLEASIQRQFERPVGRLATARRRVGQVLVVSQTVQALLPGAAMIGVAAAGAVGVLRGHLTLGELAAATLLANRAIQPLQRILAGLVAHQQAIPGRRRVAEGLARPATLRDRLPAQGAAELTLDGLSITPRVGASPLLEDANLRVAPGELVAVDGLSEASRSLLLTVLAGVVPPSAGRVLLNGIDLATLSVPERQRQFFVAGHRPVVFSGTLLENITRFSPRSEVDSARAYAAADLMGLTQLAGQLPRGFDTDVGPGSSYHLPDGVAQRLQFAQAVYAQPAVLLIDWGGSATGPRGTAQLVHMLDTLRGRCTVIVVTDHDQIHEAADRRVQVRDHRFVPAAAAIPSEGAA